MWWKKRISTKNAAALRAEIWYARKVFFDVYGEKGEHLDFLERVDAPVYREPYVFDYVGNTKIRKTTVYWRVFDKMCKLHPELYPGKVWFRK